MTITNMKMITINNLSSSSIKRGSKWEVGKRGYEMKLFEYSNAYAVACNTVYKVIS